MKGCCDQKSDELSILRDKQSVVLKVVLAINLGMFFFESYSGYLAKSTSLVADSLDMFGDACIYGMSLFALHRSKRWKSTVSLLKGMIMGLFGLVIIIDTINRFTTSGLPIAAMMTSVGTLALVANLTCAYLLLRHRNDDVNMRSTWLCSRNDVIANVAVLLASLGVFKFQSKYPDLIVGMGIALLVLKSSYYVLRESVISLRESFRQLSLDPDGK